MEFQVHNSSELELTKVVDQCGTLSTGAVIVYVVSSTGDGDAPDNCDAFFTRLKRAAKKDAGKCGLGVQYTVLGLGDQNYSAFMARGAACLASLSSTLYDPRLLSR